MLPSVPNHPGNPRPSSLPYRNENTPITTGITTIPDGECPRCTHTITELENLKASAYQGTIILKNRSEQAEFILQSLYPQIDYLEQNNYHLESQNQILAYQFSQRTDSNKADLAAEIMIRKALESDYVDRLTTAQDDIKRLEDENSQLKKSIVESLQNPKNQDSKQTQNVPQCQCGGGRGGGGINLTPTSPNSPKSPNTKDQTEKRLKNLQNELETTKNDNIILQNDLTSANANVTAAEDRVTQLEQQISQDREYWLKEKARWENERREWNKQKNSK